LMYAFNISAFAFALAAFGPFGAIFK
jgi:hypothetical protein